MNRQPIKAYTRATHTVAKTRQVVMLYDGAIRFLSQAQEAMEQKAIEQRYIKLTKASEIIMGLQGCLDFESGGDSARILYDFYTMIDLRIFELHRTNDAKACAQVIAELKTMRDVWDKIDRAEDAIVSAAAAASAVEESSPIEIKPVTLSA